MRKIFLFVFISLSYCLTAQTGCLTAEHGIQPYGTVSVWCNNDFQNITTTAKAGTYSNIEITANRTYTFKSSVATDFLTLSHEGGTEVILFGTNSIEYTPTADAVVRLYVHTDNQCGSSTTFRTMTVKCDPGPDPNDPAEPVEGCLDNAYPNTYIYTPFCNGVPEIMSDFAFTGSYSPVEVTANTTYTFKSSVPTDHITIANALGTAIILKGIGEVTWTAVADGMIQFRIYLDDQCGIGDMDEEPRIVTLQCGEQAPESEGCLEAPNGQVPVNIFVPACNTTAETVVAMANTGEYAMVQVKANTAYTFNSSIATDMITIGNEEGTEVLGYGFGTYVWTADADQLIRFYTHANASCAMDILTRRKTIQCGAPYIATEPDFDCFQGDGLASNNYETGYAISQEIPAIADDFVVSNSFTVQQIRLNLFSSNPIPSISFKFLKDSNGIPRETVQTVQNIIPTEQLIIGAKNGYYIYQVTVDLPNALTFSAGKYWLQPIANWELGAFWEMTSKGTNQSKVRVLSADGNWESTDYQAVFFISGTCINLSNDEVVAPKISFSPNPVKDIVQLSSAADIEKVSVFTIAGQLIKEQKPVNGKMNVADLKSGLYLFKVTLKTGKDQTFKIIKE